MVETDNLRYTKIALNNGSGAIPALGFGTLIPDPVATRTATKAALEAGFRQLDAAERYRNEKEVGEAMQEVFKAGKIKREEVFIATKLWNNNHRPERVKPAFEASLKKLQLDYVDLYLIHTPFAFQPGDEQDPRDANGNVIYDKGVTLLDTWRALEGLVDEGKCKAIGLSDVSLARRKRSSKRRGSSLQLFTSNPIRISRNGTFWTIAERMASCWPKPNKRVTSRKLDAFISQKGRKAKETSKNCLSSREAARIHGDFVSPDRKAKSANRRRSRCKCRVVRMFGYFAAHDVNVGFRPA